MIIKTKKSREKTKSKIRQYLLEDKIEAAASIAEKKGFPKTSMVLYSRLAEAQDSYDSKQEFYNKATQIAEENGLKRSALEYFKKSDDFSNAKRIVSELKDLEEYVELYQNVPEFIPYLLEKNEDILSSYSGNIEKIKREVAIKAIKNLKDKKDLGPIVKLFNSLGRRKFANSLIDKFIDKTSKEKRNFIEEQNQQLNDLETNFLTEEKKLKEKYETNKKYLKRDKKSKLINFQNDFNEFQNLKDSLNEK